MDLSNTLALVSLILTAISTISILAIITELCRTFKRILFDQESAINNQCGSWQSCVTNRHLPEHGLMEKAAKPLKGWIQSAYKENITHKITNYYQMTQKPSWRRFTEITHNQPTQGTSSWSKLLARCGIEPSMILEPEQNDDLTDILMENERILYGVSAEEFVVLLILGSWDTTFAQKPAGLSISHLGYMRICDGGPFRQIARYDDHGYAPITQLTATYQEFFIPIKAAIDLAIGIFRVPSHIPDVNDMIILSNRDFSEANTPNSLGSVAYWESNPDDKQLEEIRYSMEKLVQEPSAKVNNYASDEESTHKMEMFQSIAQLPRTQHQNRTVYKAAARVALLISSLEPWAVLPATPKHITEALCQVLRTQVEGGNGQEHLKAFLQKGDYSPPPHWTKDTEEGLKNSLQDIPPIKDHFFSDSSHKCSTYYTAMKAVFRKVDLSQSRNTKHHRGVPFDTEKLIRIKLATTLASKVLSENTENTEDCFPRIFDLLCQIHRFQGVHVLSPTLTQELVDIYSTYLYGWFGDATKADSGWREAYQRRIFIE
ncbi:hypothetical protein BO86DRAFT_378332 [Aspergillus japonicus CBS 114.51]|uniref:Uncharacterized protein n=1 Tax=Aspergillus japonicus CBS 114.51 TaxID=1448312 RepID=A0A8T8X3W2_ASPJA|nr:hypothetical protein BO86DRAFT_378332 [Aspergillus japonicus CBS 114.51]RAH82817.1 hypothetical protein BO86DRAFT_378332 [Aspergillus japonicus CBS 114.51]